MTEQNAPTDDLASLIQARCAATGKDPMLVLRELLTETAQRLISFQHHRIEALGPLRPEDTPRASGDEFFEQLRAEVAERAERERELAPTFPALVALPQHEAASEGRWVAAELIRAAAQQVEDHPRVHRTAHEELVDLGETLHQSAIGDKNLPGGGGRKVRRLPSDLLIVHHLRNADAPGQWRATARELLADMDALTAALPEQTWVDLVKAGGGEVRSEDLQPLLMSLHADQAADLVGALAQRATEGGHGDALAEIARRMQDELHTEFSIWLLDEPAAKRA